MDIIEFRVENYHYTAPRTPLDEKVDIYVNGRKLLDEIRLCNCLMECEYNDHIPTYDYLGLDPINFYRQMLWAVNREKCIVDLFHDVYGSDKEEKISATMLCSGKAVALVDMKNTALDYCCYSKLCYVFEKEQFENAVVKVATHVSDCNYTDLKSECVIQCIVDKIVKKLKQIPSELAPDDYRLDGYAWEEFALQMGEGESVYWETYDDMLCNMCVDELDALDNYTKELLILKAACIYDDADIRDFESAVEDARNEIIKDIHDKVLN